jgi:uncharacterized protein YdhG (YjbR/CyaY superfamily)
MPSPHDDYLAKLPDDFRTALQDLRETIASVVPDADEGLSYGLPAFRIGRPIVAYGATKKHCALYPLSPEVQASFDKELASFDQSKGTVRFQPDAPLPRTLVKKIVKARLAEIGGDATKKKATKKKATKKKATKKKATKKKATKKKATKRKATKKKATKKKATKKKATKKKATS